MKKQKKKLYAIYYTDTGDSIIVKTWDECQKKTKGRPNKFKSFTSEGEAWKWLDEIDPKKKSRHQKPAEKIKEPKKGPMQKVSIPITLDQKAVSDLRKKAAVLNMSVEFLIENLILEYLYDA